MPESSRLLIPLRWITVAAIGAIVVALGLDLAGLQGPWRVIALAAAATALACYLIVLRTVRKQIERVSTSAHQAIRAASEAGSHHDAEFDALRNELDEHRRLQAALTAAKQIAEQATLAKGEFLATMSHEVRTPLNGIIPMLDLLQSTKLSLDQREMLNTALQSARQLLRIVDDILDYSKLEANALQLENVGLNLRELLDSVIRLLERQAQAKGLRLSLHIDQEVRTAFRGDPLRLRQVLSNLISNALKFTERGSITVNVSRLSETRTHHMLRFEVRDTGVGISPEAASKLFSAFSQADASTTRMYGGTGLGLAICKRIVDLMGGRIGVESELGRGSDFWFEVPMLKTMGEIEGPRIGLLGARALVLTSDAALQRRLSANLSQSGVKQVYVSTTQDALNQLRNYAAGFDVLVIDLASIKHTVVALHRNLASMDGVERLRILFLEGGDPVPDEVRALPNAIVVPRTLAENDLRPKLGELLAGEAISTSGRDSRAAVSLVPAQERMDAQAKAAAEDVSSAFVPIKGRLLLVEDNPVNLLVAQRLISLAGMLCDTAENGEQALEKLARGHYDIVLMDCQMPVMDGYTATRQWRGHEADNDLPPLPIIAMTANAMAGDRQKCLDAGMDDYLSKPVTREHLEQTLRRWLEMPSRLRRTTAQPTPPTPAQPSAPAPAQPAPPAPAQPYAPIPAQPPVAAPAFANAAEEMPELTATAEAFQSAPIFGMPSSAPAVATKPAPAAPADILPAATQAHGPALDSEIIEDLWSAMGPQFKELVDVFLEDAPGHLTKLEAAAVVGDIAGMAGPAHALKSSSANLGAMQVSAAAKHIEHGARDRTLTNAVDAVSVLSREFRRAELELRTLLH